MHFIFGGRSMGKLAYARSLKADSSICDLENDKCEGMFAADIVNNVHLLIQDMIKAGESPESFFEKNMDKLQNKILIGDEVGCGIVPMESWEREWRDETGRVYQLLARHAADVTRIWAGIPQALKRDGRPL